MRGNLLKSKSIVSKFPKVIPEHLFIQIPEQVERFHAHVGSLDSTLEQTPEVFESVGVNLSINVRLSMVNDLVGESGLQVLIGQEGIGIDSAADGDVLVNLAMQGFLFPVRNDRCPDFPATF